MVTTGQLGHCVLNTGRSSHAVLQHLTTAGDINSCIFLSHTVHWVGKHTQYQNYVLSTEPPFLVHKYGQEIWNFLVEMIQYCTTSTYALTVARTATVCLSVSTTCELCTCGSASAQCNFYSLQCFPLICHHCKFRGNPWHQTNDTKRMTSNA